MKAKGKITYSSMLRNEFIVVAEKLTSEEWTLLSIK